jgi:mRNA-degrading endonuclease RelE of RelBE toxin-antitoxin system
LENLEKELTDNPKLGEPLGANIYKIRVAAKDKSKGKSGGFRIITYLF